ncbi:MAG: type I restriction enzyme HsdR N-terminal domain-containing protein [Deltaproteobacteria bacterium]|nr:type I restriction enzyme HsdR N-terminal domain-containing protein [Deltaproteobacteria bacterium]
MGSHHLVLGEISDFLTGELIEDTHDERYRQKLAKWLVQGKSFLKSDISPRERIIVTAGDNRAEVPLDFRIRPTDKTGMIIKYGPGSIITRHRSALALARLAAPYQIPIVVVTNGRTAEILDGWTGRRLATGIKQLPSRQELVNTMAQSKWTAISPKQIEMESRIVYAYEVDGACPCDDTVCKL